VRGAGANFGVVTEFVFRTQEVGPTVLGGLLLYPFERAASVFRAARDVLADAPDELTTSLVMLTVPPHEPFPQELWGAHAAVVAPTYTGDLAEGGRVISRLREIEKPALDVVGPMPYVALQSMLDATASFGLHQYNAAETLVELRDAGIDALLEAFVTVPSPRSHVILTQLGGAVARVPETATAFGNRDGAYLAWVISMWEPTEHAEAHVRWAREIRRSVRSLATGGTYVNALEPDAARTDRLRASYGVNWPRLVELKRRWDPDNAFRLNQNIR
jgi:FAD/FMN-containing dehydrogenase